MCLHSSGKLMLLNQTPNATFVFPYANTWFQILELIYRTFNFSLRIVRFNHVFCRIPILNWLHTCTASFWHLLTSFGIFWRLLVSFGVFFGVFLGFFCGVFRHLLFCPTGIRLHKVTLKRYSAVVNGGRKRRRTTKDARKVFLLSSNINIAWYKDTTDTSRL